MKRIASLAAAVATVAGGLVALAPAASAASVAVDCATDDGTTYTVDVRPGDTITVDNIGQHCFGFQSGYCFPHPGGYPLGNTVNFLVSPDTPIGTYTDFDGIVLGTFEPTSFITVIVGAPGDAGSPPPSAYQQVPMPTSGSCADVKDADLGYGTGLTGGWTTQWGEWANAGKGAVVCGRTIAWADGAWAIQPA